MQTWFCEFCEHNYMESFVNLQIKCMTSFWEFGNIWVEVGTSGLANKGDDCFT